MTGQVLEVAEIQTGIFLNVKRSLFTPRNFTQILFSISLGATVIPRRNSKQMLCKTVNTVFCGFHGAVSKPENTFPEKSTLLHFEIS